MPIERPEPKTRTGGVSSGAWRFQDTVKGGQGSSTELGGNDAVDTTVKRQRPTTLAARHLGTGDTTLDIATVSWSEGW